MFPRIGPMELALLLGLALLLLGPKRLPDLARSLGEALRELRRGGKEALSELEDDELSSEKKGNQE